MPLNAKGRKIKRAMEHQYGKDKGDRVFFASEKSGKIEGVKKHDGRKGKAMKPVKKTPGRSTPTPVNQKPVRGKQPGRGGLPKRATPVVRSTRAVKRGSTRGTPTTRTRKTR